jgi:hypothetical protein
MRRASVILCVVLTATIGVAGASAGGAKSKPSWTEAKAERSVVIRAAVGLPPDDREALEGEFRRSASVFRALASDATDPIEAQGYFQLADLYTYALGRVREGLRVSTADCTGSGRATRGRFTGFRCEVRSQSLVLPPTMLVSVNGEVSTDEQWRMAGPIEAILQVRVTGTSSFSYKPL